MNLHWVETCLLKPCHSHLKFLQEQLAACLILILPLPAEINVQQTWDTLLRPSGHITLHCWSRDPSGRYWFLDSSLVGRWCLEPQSSAGGQGAGGAGAWSSVDSQLILPKRKSLPRTSNQQPGGGQPCVSQKLKAKSLVT